MIMAYSRTGLDGSSENTVELIKEKMDNGSNYLQLWTRKFDNLFVNEAHYVPNYETACLTNLSDSANSDT